MAEQTFSYLDVGAVYGEFIGQARRQAVAALGLPPGVVVLDLGCGVGTALADLANAAGPGGHVIGVDAAVAHLEGAAARDGVALVAADARQALPFAPATLDVIWAADVVMPFVFPQPVAALLRFRNLLKPGGRIALSWSLLRAMFLPGYERLEGQITAALAQYYGLDAMQGAGHPERAAGWLRAAGYEAVHTAVYTAHHQVPLSEPVRRYVACHLMGYYSPAVEACGAAVGLTPDDRALWARLSSPESPDYLLDQPDYHCTGFVLLTSGRTPRAV
ncbi:MAG: methyltransferase domain-containing protein [Anaerolineae bacterium]|nr:methyltransferase domain-containing protein [Anaerolineae bacterium]